MHFRDSNKLTKLLAACASLLICQALAAHEPEVEESPNTQSPDIPFTPPTEALGLVDLPDGFQATLFAAEPNVHQPIGATFDAKGRLWVAECYTYSDRKVNFNEKLNDRILIFEDVDNDGVFDSRKVFWDQGKRVTGIEIGFGGVWVTAAPHLLFIPDRDGDDIPDGEPEVLLDGFNATTIRHNFVNGPKWGPDGWLYGRHGILATSYVGAPGATASQRQPINCGIWRYHPIHRKFEVVAHGTTNPFGFDYDRHGEMFFINTVIGHLFHVVPGARYRRMSGSHLNPHTYQVIEQTADHFHWDVGHEKWTSVREDGISDATDKAGGGHAHSGLMIYQGNNWPEEFQDKLFTLNFHGRRMNSESLHRKGNSYTATHSTDYFQTTDPWFRGVELLSGPDGGVFVLDWSDIGECHENDGVHRTSGRIFKLTYGTPEPPKYKDLTKLSDDQLIELLGEPNQWYARQARRLIQERAFAIRLALADESKDEDTKSKAKQRSDHLRALTHANSGLGTQQPSELRIMWISYVCGYASADWLLTRTHHQDEHVRSWAVRLLTDGLLPIDAATTNRLKQLAATDSSGLVRMYVASSLFRLEAKHVFKLAERLASHSSDANDRVQPNLIWYGIEPHVVSNPSKALDLAEGSKMPSLRTNIIRRLTYEIESQPDAMKRIVSMLANADSSSLRHQILSGMWLALDGIQQAPAPANWNDVSSKLSLSGDEQTKNLVQQLNLVFGDGRTIDELIAIASDRKSGIDKRRRAIQGLARAKKVPQLFKILKSHLGNKSLAEDVVRAMVQCDTPKVALAITKRYHKLSPQGQRLAINTLVARESWIEGLLDAVDSKTIPVNAISSSHARQIGNFGNEKLTARLTALWGRVESTSTEREQQIAQLRAQLTPEFLNKSDLDKGHALFEKNCASCHVMHGKGGRIGPDLTGSDRKNLNYLLENIIDPGSVVAEAFQTSVILLEDGRLLSGAIIEQNDRTLKLQTKEDILTIDRRTIEETKHTKLSLMPDGLLDQMTIEEKRDLFGFLIR